MDQDWDKLFSTGWWSGQGRHGMVVLWLSSLSLGRAATTLSKQTVEKDGARNLLPKDVHYELSDLMKLFTKPKWTVGACRV